MNTDTTVNKQWNILTYRFREESGKMNTYSTSALHMDEVQSNIDRKHASIINKNMTLEQIVCLTFVGETIPEEWSTLMLDRNMPFRQKFASLKSKHRSTKTILFETDYMRNYREDKAEDFARQARENSRFRDSFNFDYQ